MPKANDLEIYPFDPLIDPRDGVFGFDWNNAKRNRNFKMEHLRHFILQGLDPSNNGFITTTGYTLVGNLLTINAGWVWQLNGMLFTNEEEVEFPLEYTAEGFVRIDSIYANANNTFGIISGQESETIAVPPAIPVNTLLAFSINVFDTTIVGGEEPVLGNFYVKKDFFRSQFYNGSGSNVVIPLNPTGYSNIYLTGTIASVDGFDFSELIANPSIAEYPHEGKPFRIYNWTSGPLTLNHEIPNPLFFQFRNTEDFVLPVGESVQLVNNSYSLVDVDKSFTTTDDVIGLQAELDLKLDIADYNDRYKGKYTSFPNLQAAHPTANDGDNAVVDAGSGTNAIEYIWDANEGWVQGNSVGATTTDALPEGSTNLYHTSARVLATVLSGISFATGGSIVSTDTILQAFGKIQKQINDLSSVFVPQTRTLTIGAETFDLSTNRTFAGSGGLRSYFFAFELYQNNGAQHFLNLTQLDRYGTLLEIGRHYFGGFDTVTDTLYDGRCPRITLPFKCKIKAIYSTAASVGSNTTVRLFSYQQGAATLINQSTVAEFVLLPGALKSQIFTSPSEIYPGKILEKNSLLTFILKTANGYLYIGPNQIVIEFEEII